MSNVEEEVQSDVEVEYPVSSCWDDADSAKDVLRILMQPLPVKAYSWINNNEDGLWNLYDICRQEMADMGCPILEEVSFPIFAMMIAKISVVRRFVRPSHICKK